MVSELEVRELSERAQVGGRSSLSHGVTKFHHNHGVRQREESLRRRPRAGSVCSRGLLNSYVFGQVRLSRSEGE